MTFDSKVAKKIEFMIHKKGLLFFTYGSCTLAAHLPKSTCDTALYIYNKPAANTTLHGSIPTKFEMR